MNDKISGEINRLLDKVMSGKVYGVSANTIRGVIEAAGGQIVVDAELRALALEVASRRAIGPFNVLCEASDYYDFLRGART